MGRRSRPGQLARPRRQPLHRYADVSHLHRVQRRRMRLQAIHKPGDLPRHVGRGLLQRRRKPLGLGQRHFLIAPRKRNQGFDGFLGLNYGRSVAGVLVCLVGLHGIVGWKEPQQVRAGVCPCLDQSGKLFDKSFPAVARRSRIERQPPVGGVGRQKLFHALVCLGTVERFVGRGRLVAAFGSRPRAARISPHDRPAAARRKRASAHFCPAAATRKAQPATPDRPREETGHTPTSPARRAIRRGLRPPRIGGIPSHRARRTPSPARSPPIRHRPGCRRVRTAAARSHKSLGPSFAQAVQRHNAAGVEHGQPLPHAPVQRARPVHRPGQDRLRPALQGP